MEIGVPVAEVHQVVACSLETCHRDLTLGHFQIIGSYCSSAPSTCCALHAFHIAQPACLYIPLPCIAFHILFTFHIWHSPSGPAFTFRTSLLQPNAPAVSFILGIFVRIPASDASTSSVPSASPHALGPVLVSQQCSCIHHWFLNLRLSVASHMALCWTLSVVSTPRCDASLLSFLLGYRSWLHLRGQFLSGSGGAFAHMWYLLHSLHYSVL